MASPSNPPAGEEAFRRVGLKIEFHPDAASALIAIGRREPALVVLPCDVVGIPLIDLVAAIVRDSRAPVLVAIEGGTAESGVRALDVGARGLVGLPLAPAELDAALRRWHPAEGDRHAAVIVGTLAIDTDAHRVTVGGTEVHLSVREVALLRVLAGEADHILAAEDLARAIGEATSSSVRVMLGRIRRKLAAAAPESRVHLETVRGAGYRIAVR